MTTSISNIKLNEFDDVKSNQNVPHTSSYYLKCMFGGALSCGLTHTMITPLDVVKCNMQAFPGRYPNLAAGLRSLYVNNSLMRGWAPTMIGYSMQGFCKFGFYEIFKDSYANLVGEENATKYKGLIWLAASASAEFIADIALCPMEMAKVRMQMSEPAIKPPTLFNLSKDMMKYRNKTGFPFGSLKALWGRQIPYTMAKFYFFEKISSMIYEDVLHQQAEDCSYSTQLGITFTSGYLAGIICATVSQPADNIVSQLGSEMNQGKRFMDIVREVGLVSMATKGMGTRILMVGTLTGFQWWIYDAYKKAFGLGVTGGSSSSSSSHDMEEIQ